MRHRLNKPFAIVFVLQIVSTVLLVGCRESQTTSDSIDTTSAAKPTPETVVDNLQPETEVGEQKQDTDPAVNIRVDVAFGLLFGVAVGNLYFVCWIVVVASKGLECLQEIRDLLKDRKGD